MQLINSLTIFKKSLILSLVILNSIFNINAQLKRPILSPKNYPIILPDNSYNYFLLADKYKFESNKKGFSLINAWWLTEISFLTYATESFSAETLKVAGFPNIKYFIKKNAVGLITWNDDVIIISFRGTEMNSIKIVNDIITDLNTAPADFKLGGKVHKGFLTAFESIWLGSDGMNDFLKTLINEKRTIWLTGHSLGAAMATICFTELKNASALYTIGSPRVGNKVFVDLNKGRDIFRIVNNKDPFPLTPPSLPAYKFFFVDSGDLIFIDDVGNIKRDTSKTTDANDHLLAKKLGDGDFFDSNFIKNIQIYSSYFNDRYSVEELNIFDHMPVFYSLKLWNKMVAE